MNVLGKLGEKQELLSATPRVSLTLLTCSPNLPHVSINLHNHATHEPIIQ